LITDNNRQDLDFNIATKDSRFLFRSNAAPYSPKNNIFRLWDWGPRPQVSLGLRIRGRGERLLNTARSTGDTCTRWYIPSDLYDFAVSNSFAVLAFLFGDVVLILCVSRELKSSTQMNLNASRYRRCVVSRLQQHFSTKSGNTKIFLKNFVELHNIGGMGMEVP